MYRKSLSMRVWDGVLKMSRGEKTTVGKIATIEGVSKSPELYRVLGELVEAGYLELTIGKHSNGRDMHIYTRTFRPDNRQALPFESEGA